MRVEPPTVNAPFIWHWRDYVKFLVAVIGLAFLVLAGLLLALDLLHQPELADPLALVVLVVVFLPCRVFYQRILHPSPGLRLVVVLGYVVFALAAWSGVFRH